MYADTTACRAEASPGAEGTCPACGQPVRPKCGSIVVHHWAHRARRDCDSWSEPEGEWHRGWKLAVPPERREVVIGPHRADVVTASGGVAELQHSAISPEVIREREDFYGERMASIFDMAEAFTAGRLIVHPPPQQDPGADHFRWKNPRRSLGACQQPLLLDLGNGIVLHVVSMISTADAGWCRPLTRESVAAWLRDGSSWQVRRVPPEPPPKRPNRSVSDLERRYGS